MQSNFEIFVCQISDKNVSPHKIDGEALVKRAALVYGACEDEIKNAKLLRTSQGKPYFKESGIHFNISHSGNLWMCLMGPSCCGLDVQHVRPCNFEKIAGRFFSEREQEYVRINGIEGFFKIWARKEAYGKYTGQGFFGECPELVLEDGKAAEKLLEEKEKTVILKELYIGEGVKCVACFESKGEANIIIREDWDYEDYVFIR